MRRLVTCVGVLAGLLGACAPAALAASGKPVRPTDRARAERALSRAEDLLAGHGVRTGRELTPALARLARREAALSTADRRRARAVLARPTSGASDPEGHGYTTGQATPVCTAHFCVHYVTTTADAPSLADTSPANGVPDYVETMASTFEFVYSKENGSEASGGLGWAPAKSDGTHGGNSKTDVYIAQIGDEGIFGYAAPEQTSVSAYAYLVMDDDYSEFGFANPLDALRVTAAHEYNHVLQFNYDSLQDLWMLEATAVWAEDQVYPTINDYVNYVNSWTGCTEAPLTAGAAPGCGLKIYGSAVWNHFIEARHGADAIRRAWELSDSTTPDPHLAPDAYDESVAAEGGAGFGDEFGRFAAAVAEWETPGSPFPDNASYPDVERTGVPLAVGGGPRTVLLDHTTFALIDVTPDALQSAIVLRADAPAGLDATVALVGRTGGDAHAGGVTTQALRLPSGGAASVTLPNPGGYGRITAVLANADFSQSGFNGTDWIWTRDGQPFQNVQVLSAGAAATAPRPIAPALISRLAVRSPQRLRTALRRGVLARVRCNQACRVRVELRLDRATARRLGVKRVVGTRVVSLERAGVKSVRVRIGKRARGKLRGRKRVRLTARMRATHGSARAALLSRRVTLKR